MSTDMERELRELFRDKAGDAPVSSPDVSTGTPQPVLRRARLHQIATVAGSAAVAFAIAAGSVAGLSSLLRGGERVGGGEYEVFRRDATIEAFSLSSPSDWFLVNQWPRSVALASAGGSASKTCTVGPSGTETCTEEREPVDPIHPPVQGLPILQLTNIDLGLASNVCRDGLPSGGAALYIALDPAANPGDLTPFPPGPMPGLPEPSSDGPCGAGSYSRFTVNGYPIFSWVAWDAIAKDEDRATVQRTWEQMWAHDDWQPSRPESATAAYVLAGGGPIGHEWRLDLRYLGDSLELTLENGRGGQVLEADESAAPLAWSGTDPIFGVVAEGTAGVEFRPGTENVDADLGGSPIPGMIVDAPPSIDAFDLDLFFIDLPAGYEELDGRVVVTGEAAPSPSTNASPGGKPRPLTVELAGTFDGQGWSTRFRGSFADDTACIRVTIGDVSAGGEVYEPYCPEPLETSLAGDNPSLHGWLTDGFYLLAGSVPSEVADIRFAGEDDAIVPQRLRCATGPLGWTDPDRKVCAMTLPPEGSGTLRYLDADGDVLFEEGIGWGQAEPDVCCPVAPRIGGTYSAVYAWLGTHGASAAADEVRRLSEDLGVEAWQGSLACDEGAAEALRTAALSKVAVYFETRAEAERFALAAGLLGHDGEPVVARVTIRCLE